MNLEKLLSVPATSFLERRVKLGDSNIAEVCTHHSIVVNDSG